MSTARKNLNHWRSMSKRFEWMLKEINHLNPVVKFYGEQCGLENPTVKELRKFFARKIKYWKTVVRYPVDRGEVVLVGFHNPNVKYEHERLQNLKFPIKAVIIDDWDGFPNTAPMVLIGENFVAPINNFLTTSSKHNFYIKQYNGTIN